MALLVVLAALNSRDLAGGGASAIGDHGNTIATATVITPGTHTGTIAPAGDVEVFRLNVPASTSIVVELHFDTLPRGTVALMSGSGLVLDEATDSAPRVARANYNAKEPGAYYIRVSSDFTNATGTYWIVVTAR